MNYKNFDNSASRKSEKETESGKCFCASHEDVCAALENEFEMFTEIAEILARQEYKKRRFCSFLKKAVFAFSSVLFFSGIIVFAKKRKSGKNEKTKN